MKRGVMGKRAFRSVTVGILLGVMVACCSAALPAAGRARATVGHQAWRFAYISGEMDALNRVRTSKKC